MRKIFFLLLTFHISYLKSEYSFSQAKGGTQQKLFDMYVMGKYEDCAFKAENMSMNEKFKKDPEPFLYLSMCFLKISQMDSDQLDEHYKEPLKESLKYAKKFRAKDKDGSMYNNNRSFFDTLKIVGIEQAKNFYYQNQYAKAAAYLGMLNGFDEKDNNVKFMKGVYDILAKNAVEGAKSINDAMSGLLKSRSDAASEPLLAEAMLIYSDYLSKNKMQDSAQKTITFAKEFFPQNKEVKNQYNLLHGLPSDEDSAGEKNTEQKYEMHQPDTNANIQIPESKTDSAKSENKEMEIKEEPPKETPPQPNPEKTDEQN